MAKCVWLCRVAAVALFAGLGLPAQAGALESLAREAFSAARPVSVQPAGTLEVAFSPDEGAEALVVKVIDSARSDIRLLAYSFTSAPVTDALLRARRRGVSVGVVADAEQVSGAKSARSKAVAALSALANAGCEVRIIDAFDIHHDKVVIADKETVQTGSFNYSAAAAHRNSENVLVVWRNPLLAKAYLAHFERNYQRSKSFSSSY